MKPKQKQKAKTKVKRKDYKQKDLKVPKKDFHYWNTKGGDFVLRAYSIYAAFMLLVLVIFIGYAKIRLDKINHRCEGDRCVEVKFSFEEHPHFVPGVDKRKYQEIFFYKNNSKKVTYYGWFDCHDEAVLSVEPGHYHIETRNGKYKKDLIIREKQDIFLP